MFADLNADNEVDETEILQQNHYYPFGMNMEGAWSNGTNKYQFNGVELNDDFDLGINLMPFRSYDPGLGRFWQVDPLTEMADDFSPYHFSFNDPFYFSDPLGLYGEYAENGEEIGADGMTNSQWMDASNPLSGSSAQEYIQDSRAFVNARNRFWAYTFDRANDPFLEYGGDEVGRRLDDAGIHIYYAGTLYSASESVGLPWMQMASGLAATMDGESDPIFAIITLGQSVGMRSLSFNNLFSYTAKELAENSTIFYSGFVPRVPKGELWLNLITGKPQTGGTFFKKALDKINGYLKFGDKHTPSTDIGLPKGLKSTIGKDIPEPIDPKSQKYKLWETISGLFGDGRGGWGG